MDGMTRSFAGLMVLLTLQGGGCSSAQQTSPMPTQIQPTNDEKKGEVFADVFADKRAFNATQEVSIRPTESVIKRREMMLVNGKTPVLSIPAEVKNLARHPIRTLLTHEWHGGIWPETDLYVAVKAALPGDSEDWETSPGFLVGESGSRGSDTELRSGERRSVDIRLNWPGTGSLPTEPLISNGSQGKYFIRFLLFYRSEWGERHMETQDFEFEVE